MRVVGGRLKGRNIAAPTSRDIRPTADRLRESVFNILVHAYDDPIEDARVLDLFAGTGALGIEAVSRGAAFTLFVDNGAEARALLRNNVEALALGGVTKVYRRDATDLGPAWRTNRWPRCATAGGSRPARSWWWRKRKRRALSRPMVSRSWSGAPMTTRSSCFCEDRSRLRRVG
jgi:hypothetical protein